MGEGMTDRFHPTLESVATFQNLYAAYEKAAKGKRHRFSVAEFFFNLEGELLLLRSELLTDTYTPGEFDVFEVFEPKHRKIAAAPFRDRVVHHAVFNDLESGLEKIASDRSFACRKGMGTHAAIKEAQRVSRLYPYVLQVDIKKFFESVDHEVLEGCLAELVNEKRLLSLLHTLVAHTPSGFKEGKGLPIGNLTSQHFANLYLSKVDRFIENNSDASAYIRYMDDLLVFARDKWKLWQLLHNLRVFLGDCLKLRLKEEVTRVYPVSEGMPFLGARIFPGLIRLQAKSRTRFIRHLRAREHQFSKGQIDNECLERSVTGLLGHTLPVNTLQLRKELISSSSQT
jgi:RNA-directed DNA polymerase